VKTLSPPSHFLRKSSEKRSANIIVFCIRTIIGQLNPMDHIIRRIRTHSSTRTTFAQRSKSAKYVVGSVWPGILVRSLQVTTHLRKYIVFKTKYIYRVVHKKLRALSLFNLCTAFIYPIKVRGLASRKPKHDTSPTACLQCTFILYAIPCDPFDFDVRCILIISENTT